MDKNIIDKKVINDNTLVNLLDIGKWHFGLICKDGNIIVNTELWPQYPKISNGDVVWQNEYGELKPIIWFGKNNAYDKYCLSIFDHENVNIGIGYDYRKTISEFRYCCSDNAILQKIDKIEASCPVSIAKNDSSHALLMKVEEYCYHMQKKHVLEVALYDYGYNYLGRSYVERPIEDEDFDDRVLLPDGRLAPSFIYEWACEQMSEDLYGDAQADMIEIDDRYFLNEHDGNSSYYWNVLERYFDDVEEYILKGLGQCLEDNYGKNWQRRSSVRRN